MKTVVKFGFVMVILLTVATTTVWSNGDQESGEVNPVVIKAMHFSTDSDLGVAPGYKALIEKINENAGGKLVIENVGASESISGFDQFEAIASGVIDFGIENESYYGSQITGTPITHLSRLSPEGERAKGYIDVRSRMLEVHNVKYLGRPWGYGMGYCVYTNIDVAEPESGFEGQRIRISPAYAPLAAAIKVTPVVIPFPDIYTAMERSTIDGFIIASSMALEYSWEEVTKYFTDPPVYNINLEILMNLDKWNSLSPELQEIISGSISEFESESKSESIAYVENYRKRMIDAGMVPLDWSDADIKWFADTAFDASWKDLDMKYVGDKALLQEMKSIIK